MNTPLLQELKQYLGDISKEKFQKEWEEIKAQNFGGPTVDEFLKSLSFAVKITDIRQFSEIGSSVDLENVNIQAGENNYSLAA